MRLGNFAMQPMYAIQKHLANSEQSFTKANLTPRSCGALTRVRTHSRQLGANQLRICEGYGQPTFTATAFITKISKQHTGREPGKRNQEHRASRALLGMQTRATRAVCRGPAVLTRRRNQEGHYGTQTHRCTNIGPHHPS